MLRLLEGSGFVGSLGRPIMRYHSYILHMLVFASRAFYDSPRGRWIWKVFLEVRGRVRPRGWGCGGGAHVQSAQKRCAFPNETLQRGASHRANYRANARPSWSFTTRSRSLPSFPPLTPATSRPHPQAFFLYIYHSIQLMPDETSLHWQHIVFVLYLAGMLVDEWQEGAHQYGGRIAQYFASGFNMVEAMCWLMLVAASGLKIAMWALPDGQVCACAGCECGPWLLRILMLARVSHSAQRFPGQLRSVLQPQCNPPLSSVS